MKISVTINGAEIILEAQAPREIEAMGPLLKSLVGNASANAKSGVDIRQSRQKSAESELSRRRADAISTIMTSFDRPMNAPDIAQRVKDIDVFGTKTGDPVHLVRRALSSDERFEKTVSGLFTLRDNNNEPASHSIGENQQADSNITPARQHVAYANENDIDDPFADN